MAANEFSISARDLDAAGKRYCFTIRAPWIRGALEGTDVQATGTDGEIDVRLSKSGTDVVVRGTITAELVAPCARCLREARIVVKEAIATLVVPATSVGGRNATAGDEHDLSAEHADVVTYDGETVVLDDLVRDELLLGVPMIPLCSEGCPGIRPESPSESPLPAVDPRLRPLLRLKKSPT